MNAHVPTRRTARSFCGYILVAVLILSAVTFRQAEAQGRDEASSITVRARVEAKNDPQKAIGLVLSSSGSQQVPNATISKVGDKLYDVTFEVAKTSLTEDSVATAIAYSEAGDVYFANVTPPVLSPTHALLASIPECPAEDGAQVARLGQIGDLQKLVDLRMERTKYARMRIDAVLSSSLSNRLKKAEQLFGISSGDELSSALPAKELVDRLARINFALKNYRAFKKASTPAPATAGE